MTKRIGILTSGGDSPGLNAAIRGVGKSAIYNYGMEVIGFKDGFRGLAENRTVPLDADHLSGILTLGGTILGTSRDKPHKMPVNGKKVDMTDTIVEVVNHHELDALICLGGGGTAKNAYQLHQKGVNVITLPKTIDNDVWGTDVTFGFDTAMSIATEAIDRLHSTAHSHYRIIVVEVMGHNTGWLTLAAGIAGGADVILIPEIPYDVNRVAAAILDRRRAGKDFSIVAVAEGAMSSGLYTRTVAARDKLDNAQTQADKPAKKQAKAELADIEEEASESTRQLSRQLERLTGLESRVTILGYVQRGGTPSALDRLLATRLGTAAAHLVAEGVFGVMVAVRGDGTEVVPLEEVVGKRKSVPLYHAWVEAARNTGIAFGD